MARIFRLSSSIQQIIFFPNTDFSGRDAFDVQAAGGSPSDNLPKFPSQSQTGGMIHRQPEQVKAEFAVAAEKRIPNNLEIELL